MFARVDWLSLVACVAASGCTDSGSGAAADATTSSSTDTAELDESSTSGDASTSAGGAGGSAGSSQPEPCSALTCEDVGAQCGKIDDGCGNKLDCGACEAPNDCGVLQEHQCGCEPQLPAEFIVPRPLEQFSSGSDWHLFATKRGPLAITDEQFEVAAIAMGAGGESTVQTWRPPEGDAISVTPVLGANGIVHAFVSEAGGSYGNRLRVFHRESGDGVSWSNASPVGVPPGNGPGMSSDVGLVDATVADDGFAVVYFVSERISEQGWDARLEVGRYNWDFVEVERWELGVFPDVWSFDVIAGEGRPLTAFWSRSGGAGSSASGPFCTDDRIEFRSLADGGWNELPSFPRIYICDLDSYDYAYTRPSIALDDRGRMLVATGHTYTREGVFGVETADGFATRRLGDLVYPRMALDPSGGVHVFGWTDDGLVYGYSPSAEKDFVFESVDAGEGATSPRIAIADDGRIFMGFLDGDGRLRVASDGRWCNAA